MLVSEPQAELPHGGVDPWVTPALQHEQLSLIESCAAVSAHQQGHHPDTDSPLVLSSGHSFPLYSLLAVVFGEIRKENSSVTGPGGEFACGCGCGLRSPARGQPCPQPLMVSQ